MGPYPRGCWQRPAVFLEASEACTSEPHGGGGWSKLGCWRTQAHGFPVTPRGAEQWRQQGWWLPSPGWQLRGQAPSYREKKGVSSPTTQDPFFCGLRASAWTRATKFWTLSSILEVHQLPGHPWLPKEAGTMCSTDRLGLRQVRSLAQSCTTGNVPHPGRRRKGKWDEAQRDGEEGVGITCRQLPEEGVGWLGPRLESAQRRVSQDPRFLGTEDSELEMRRGGHRPSPQPITGRHTGHLPMSVTPWPYPLANSD